MLRGLTNNDVESNLDLRDTLGHGWNANEVEVAEEFVVPYEPMLMLENPDLQWQSGHQQPSRRSETSW
jgi:hypothetical protein